MIRKPLNRWTYAIVGTVAMVFAGLIYAWTMFKRPIYVTYPAWNSPAGELTFTFIMSGFCIGGLLGGILQKKLKPYIIMWIGGILLLIGFILTSRAGSLFVLYIGMGLFAGLGSGISYNVIMSCVSRWFPDKKGLSSGMLLLGFGIGSFLLGTVYTNITKDNGEFWRTAFLALGIILIIVMFLASFFTVYPPAGWKAPTSAKPQKDAQFYQNLRPSQMLKNRNFWLYMVWTLLMSGGGLMIIALGSDIVVEAVSIDESAIAIIVGLISIFNAVGRIIFGFLFDKIGRFAEMLIGGIVYIVSMLLTLMAISSHSIFILVVAYIFAGLAYSCVTPTNSSFALQFFGPENYAVNLPIVNLNLLVASFSSMIAKSIYQSAGSFNPVLFMIIGFAVVGIIVNFLIRKPKNI